MIRHRQIDVDWNVLDRYFSGEASPDETASVARWSTSAEGAELLRSAREIWDAAGVTPAASTPDLQSRWESLWERALLVDASLAQAPVTRTSSRSSEMSTTGRRPWRGSRTWPALIAACMVGAVGLLGLDRIPEWRSGRGQPAV